MRILYVSDAASVHTRRWAEYFRDCGAEVHVASFRSAVIDGVEVHVLPTRSLGRLGYLAAIPRLRALARQIRPAIVHAQYVTSYGFLAAAAGLKPLVVTAWGSDVLVSPRSSKVMRWLARYAVRSADQVTTVAEHMNSAVVELGASEATVLAMPFGVDLQMFHPPTDPRSEDVPLRVISTRNFDTVYSVHTVIEAFHALRRGGVAAHLDLVGEGPLRKDLEMSVADAGLRPWVDFHGHVSHLRLAALLGQADVFVSSALSDGNNVSLNEAMACGCFPIASDIPANSQWIVHGDNGYLFPAGDAGRLGELVTMASTSPILRTEAAGKNRQIVEARADWKVCTRRMQSVYERLARASRT